LFTEVPEVVRRKAIRRIWLLIEKYACTRKSIIAYTVSNAVANELKHRYGKSFKVIRNFPYYKKTVSASKERIILYRGAVNEGRGLEVLIAAMKNIDAKLLIAGDGDITLSLQKLTEKLNLHHKIIFTGYLSPDELDQRSSQACIGVNLLDASSLNYYYSLANKFFDYVQLQIPQVCMNYPEYREMNIQHQVALLIDELKIEVVEQALQELLNNTALYHHLLLNCKMAAKEWCWQNEEKKLLDIYKD
jgi:glycosyltransferase involved in cell wall biosynthesis